MTLNTLRQCRTARISGLDADPANRPIVDALRDIGLAEGDEIEVLGAGPIGRTPLSVRVGTRLVAMRRSEAALVQVIGT